MVVKQHHKWDSPSLRHEFNVNVYGTGGRICVVFPSSEGRFWDFESWGMVDTVQNFLDNNQLQLFCVDSIDDQEFFNKVSPPAERGKRHREYEECIVNEVVPFVHKLNDNKDGIIVTGCSWGAYHSVNFILKYPALFHTCIALSGVYSLGFLLGDFVNDDVYFSDPLRYLPGLSDKTIIDQLKKDNIIIVVGQGAWEAESIHDSKAVAYWLKEKGVDVWLDMWGEDVAHDWYWWRKMFPYHIEKVLQPKTTSTGQA